MQETEVNNCLPFLDILITWANGSFSTSVFHKPTFTGLYTKYNSFITSVYKTGLISSLFNRYFSICSSYFIFDLHLQNLKKTYLLNGYPNSFIDTCICRFLDKIFSPSPKISLAPKKIVYFCLPYTGQHSLQIRTQIRKLCSSAFPHINLRFVFRPSLRLSHFFVFKDRIPKALRSRVVYRFKCQRCSSLYVGQTSRLLHTRISEHLGISALTGKKRVNPPPTSILSHHCDTGHPVSPDDFTILSSSFNSELLVRESLLIRKLNPLLNANIGSFPLSLF